VAFLLEEARMRRLIAKMRQPETREFLAWCAPALFIALALRITLSLQLPYACFRDDTHDFLLTPDRFFHAHALTLETKKTFLAPTVFTLSFFAPFPALIVISIFQHLLGVASVLISGLLCRLWFARWRIFIVPLTLVLAANPSLLWFEHTVMAETIFVFMTLLLALAGTLYALEPSRGRFVFFLLTLFFEAGARPEGKLFFGFAILFVFILHARAWRKMWPRFLAVLLLAIATLHITRTTQSGLLLYTSVARFTPPDLKAAPGLEPYIAPMRDELQRRWETNRTFPDIHERSAIYKTLARYTVEHEGRRAKRERVDWLCHKMAVEIIRRNLFALPAHVYHKFRAVSNALPGEAFDAGMIYLDQRLAFNDRTGRAARLSRGLTGETLLDQDAFNRFIDAHYHEIAWFNEWRKMWTHAFDALRLPDQELPNPRKPNELRNYRGIPLYFVVAALGLIAVAFRRDRLQPFHIAWGAGLLAFFFLVILVGNVRPRFRLVLEPFWFIYIALLCDCVLAKYFPAKGRPASAGKI
jgi:hypothetical protein